MFSGEVRARQRLELPDGRTGQGHGRPGVPRRAVGADAAAGAGQVARLLGLGEVRVGDGFGTSSRAEDHHFPPPTLESSVRACDPAQEPALAYGAGPARRPGPADRGAHRRGRPRDGLPLRPRPAGGHRLDAGRRARHRGRVLRGERAARRAAAPGRHGRGAVQHPDQPLLGHDRAPALPGRAGHRGRLRPRRPAARPAAVPLQVRRALHRRHGRARRPRPRPRAVRLGGDRLPGDPDRGRLRLVGRPALAARPAAHRAGLPQAHPARRTPGAGPRRRRRCASRCCGWRSRCPPRTARSCCGCSAGGARRSPARPRPPTSPGSTRGSWRPGCTTSSTSCPTSPAARACSRRRSTATSPSAGRPRPTRLSSGGGCRGYSGDIRVAHPSSPRPVCSVS